MIVISNSLVLASTPETNDNNPLIGYRNLVSTGNVSATTEATAHPVTNVANPSTNLRWQAEMESPEQDQYLTVMINSMADVDYVAIARHNLFTIQTPVSIEGLASLDSPEDWVELVQDVILPTDGPALFRFTPQPLVGIRIKMQAGNAAPTIAVVYVGKLLVVQRRIYVGHSPARLSRTTRVVNARSESGNFLGRIVLSESRGTSWALKNLTADWYREQFDPFVEAAVELPFFAAWRPGDYPNEVEFAWLTGDVKPTNMRTNGMQDVSFGVQGVSL